MHLWYFCAERSNSLSNPKSRESEGNRECLPRNRDETAEMMEQV